MYLWDTSMLCLMLGCIQVWFYDFDAVAWLHVLKNIVCAFIGNFIGGGIFVGLVYAYLNGRRDSWHSKS